MNNVNGCLYVNGKYWACKFRVYDEASNSKKQITRSTGVLVEGSAKSRKWNAARKEAERVMNAVIEDYISKHCKSESRESDMTLSQYIEQWLLGHSINLQTSTRYQYTMMYNRNIKPYWDAHPIAIKDLKIKHLDDYYNSFLEREKPLSPNTIRKFHTMISAALKDACRYEYISRNVASFAKLPKCNDIAEEDKVFYDENELREIIKISRGTVLETPVIIACVLGLRRSEIVGLRWSSIDFNKRIIKINGKVVNNHNNDGNKYDFSETMKTRSSKSYYPMSELLYQYLYELREKQRDMLRVTDKYTDYVCVNSVGELIKPDYITSTFPKLLKKNSLKHIRFHDLRHSCISLLKAMGCEHKDLIVYARHSNANITDRYTHITDNKRIDMVNKISGVLLESEQ